LFEPGHLGGCIKTTPFEGHLVDEGPDAFLTRVPDAVRLSHELAIDSELVAPSARRAAIWINGRLRPLPEGLVYGVPDRPTAVLKTGILSPLGAARASLDLILPRTVMSDPLTVRDLVRRRLGSEVADRLVDPLVGSIYAGSTRILGAAEVVPVLASAAQSSRSMMIAMRRLPRGPESPLFLAPKLGMQRLVDSLVEGLSGVEFTTERVSRLSVAEGDELVVEPTGARFDAAVVAVPARTASQILGSGSLPSMSSLESASVALLTAALEDADLPADLSGFLVPASAGRMMSACSFASRKWPHWADQGRQVVRISAGRHGNDTAMELDDGVLTDRLIDELEDALRVDIRVVATRVSRWWHSFPQYTPGHGSRVSAAEGSLARSHPGVFLAGSSYHGIGIPACIASGRRAARMAHQRAKAVA
jgi:oxygen-dependent protoporphyrinogen oxidase